jgi:transposase-like protein
MGQTLHGCARTTQAVRRSIQRSQQTVAALASRHGVDRKTVAKWRKRQTVEDAPMGPKRPRSTVLTTDEEATAVAFRRHTLLPPADCSATGSAGFKR